MVCPSCQFGMVKNGIHRGKQRWLCTSCNFLTSHTQEWFDGLKMAYDDYIQHYIANRTEVNTGVKRQSILNWLNKAQQKEYSYCEYMKEVNPFVQLGWVKWRLFWLEEYLSATSNRFVLRPYSDGFEIILILKDGLNNQSILEATNLRELSSKSKTKVNVRLNSSVANSIVAMNLNNNKWLQTQLLQGNTQQFENISIFHFAKNLLSEESLENLLQLY